jgi:hypothetical protein
MLALTDCLAEAEKSPPRKTLSKRLPDSQSVWAQSTIKVIKDTSKDDLEFGLRFLMKHTIPGQKVLQDLIHEASRLLTFHSFASSLLASSTVREHKVFSSCASYYTQLDSRNKPTFLRCFASEFTLSELQGLGFRVSEKNCRTARKRVTVDPLPTPLRSLIPPEEYRDAVEFLEAISQPSRRWKWLKSFTFFFLSLIFILLEFPAFILRALGEPAPLDVERPPSTPESHPVTDVGEELTDEISEPEEDESEESSTADDDDHSLEQPSQKVVIPDRGCLPFPGAHFEFAEPAVLPTLSTLGAQPAAPDPHKLRKRSSAYEYVNIRTIFNPATKLHEMWVKDRTKRTLTTKMSESTFALLTRNRYAHPEGKSDYCDYCKGCQDWIRDLDDVPLTSVQKRQKEAYEQHRSSYMEQRKRFKANKTTLGDGECRIVADYAEKLRLPVRLIQCSQEFYSYKAVSCLSFVVHWKDGAVLHGLGLFCYPFHVFLSFRFPRSQFHVSLRRYFQRCVLLDRLLLSFDFVTLL